MPWCFSSVFTIRVLVIFTRSVCIFPFLLSFCLQCCLLIYILAFRSPRSIILCVFSVVGLFVLLVLGIVVLLR